MRQHPPSKNVRKKSHAYAKEMVREMTEDFTVFQVYMKETRKGTESPIINGKDSALSLLEVVFDGLDRENFIVILLGPMSELIGINTVSVGSTTCTVIHPREVFKPAILGNACAVVLAHNHPSGDFTPSKADIQISKILRDAGVALQMPVLDHIVWSKLGHYSFAENNWGGSDQKTPQDFPAINWEGTSIH